MPEQRKIYYRQCFETPAGIRVLTDILIQAGFFDYDLKTEGDIEKHNLAVYILHCLGVYDMKNIQQQEKFVKSLFNIPIEWEEKGIENA